MNNIWKPFFVTLLAAFIFMSLVLFWDYYALKADVFHWSYILVKGITIGSCLLMGIWVYRHKAIPSIFLDIFGFLFYAYSFYGMACIDMTYSYSFIEAFFVIAFVVKPKRFRFYLVLSMGVLMSFGGFYFAKEPIFVAAGESYKSHAMTITYLCLAIAIVSYEMITHYNEKFMALNAKFALIGKQSSFLMHEIKNPLNRVVANSQNDFSSDIMDDIRKDSQKISGLVASIETLIHDPARLTKTFSKFDLDEIRTMLTQDYGSYMNSMNIDYDFSELQGAFYGNKYLIYQLVKNLMMNAIEAIGYRKDERSKILIRVLRKPKLLTIKMENTNSTIAPKDIHQIFDPHFTTKTNPTNKGLGLALGKNIVEAHHGKIIVTSKDNLTSFAIDLPDYSESAVKV